MREQGIQIRSFTRGWSIFTLNGDIRHWREARFGGVLSRRLKHILADLPELEREDIRACLAFAADRERKLTKIPV